MTIFGPESSSAYSSKNLSAAPKAGTHLLYPYWEIPYRDRSRDGQYQHRS